ncbi:MAG: MFS transporter [Gammaproteobacteria bacterium]|nr:MAG: MFS transporter [Gammaproteobacteria bacterium]
MNAHHPGPGTAAPAVSHSGSSTDPDFPAGRIVVVTLVAAALFVLTQLYAAIPLLSPVATDLGGSATFALSTSFSLTYAVGFLIWGPVSDRYGRKRIMAIAIGVLAVATLLCGFASSLPALAVLRALQGLAAAGFAPVALAYLTEAVTPARRVGAIGAMSTAFLVAGIFGQVVASLIVLCADWEWFFLLSAAVLAVTFILTLALVREVPRHAPPMSLLKQFGTLARLLVKPVIVLLSIANVTLLLSFVALYTGIGQHLESFDVPASDIILIRSVALPAMFVCLFVGTLAKRLGVTRVAQLGFTLAAIGMLGEALLSGTLPGLISASIVYVAGVALAVPSMINLHGETAAPNRASGMAINGFVLFIGASIGPLVGGAVTDFSTLAIILVALLILAAVSILGVAILNRKGTRS